MIQAKLITDTTSPDGERVLTFITHAPKFLDGECEKHGNLATNSSSSRALSFPATARQERPFIPATFQEVAKSMHGTNLVDVKTTNDLQATLSELYYGIVEALKPYSKTVHKQHLNRYIEPWTMQTKVWTGNLYAFENFFNLRISHFADPNINELAQKMKYRLVREMKETLVHASSQEGILHIPFISLEESEAPELSIHELIHLSAGRLARVSFDNLDELEDADTALARAKRLVDNAHKSCFEHQLTTEPGLKGLHPHKLVEKVLGNDSYWTHTDGEYLYSGRARGWMQGRKIIWNSSLDTE